MVLMGILIKNEYDFSSNQTFCSRDPKEGAGGSQRESEAEGGLVAPRRPAHSRHQEILSEPVQQEWTESQNSGERSLKAWRCIAQHLR